MFFAPVFVFDTPYAAVAGLTIAHGYQYLLIVGLWRLRDEFPRRFLTAGVPYLLKP